MNRRLSFEVRDPDQARGEALRLGIDPDLGGVAVRQGEQVERAETMTEQDITGALVRLQRGVRRTLCIAVGHGQASFADEGSDGLAEAGRLLVSNGYVLEPVDLLAGPEVPPRCEGLVMANPTAPLGAAGEAVARYLAADGRVLFLHDPGSPVDIGPLVAPYGLTVHRGIVFEGDPDSALADDPTAPVVRRYTASHPVARRVPPTFFPGVQGIEVGEGGESEGLTGTRLADTSPDSFLEVRPLTPSFDEGEDRRGPITVAAAADKSRVEGDSAKRTRLVVVGDVDFATNPLVQQAGNATLLQHAVDWLTADRDTLVLSANLPEYRPLSLTQGQLAYARLLAAGIVPGLFLLAGALVWALRRPR